MRSESRLKVCLRASDSAEMSLLAAWHPVELPLSVARNSVELSLSLSAVSEGQLYTDAQVKETGEGCEVTVDGGWAEAAAAFPYQLECTKLSPGVLS